MGMFVGGAPVLGESESGWVVRGDERGRRRDGLDGWMDGDGQRARGVVLRRERLWMCGAGGASCLCCDVTGRHDRVERKVRG
jgi:hypothetical protein